MFANRIARRAFSLIELVIVVVIIGIIAAIAVPRMSRGSQGAVDSAVAGDLATLRNAIDLFQTEHAGLYPSNAKDVNLQLTTYTDDAGSPQATKDATHIYGPYLRAAVVLPVGAAKGGSKIAAATGAGVGWIYDDTANTIKPNTTTETDTRGTLFSSY